MSERKYYVLCADNCKFEGMTKEQIITAIQEAVKTGEIKDIDAGFITKVKEQNAGRSLTFWVGTTAEFNAIPEAEKNAECLYIKTDDTFQEDVINAIKEIAELADATFGKIPPQAEIIINTVGGDFVCMHENGTEIKPSKQLKTMWVFPTPKYGTYTITGVYKDITRTQTVTVDAVKQYPIDFAFYNDNFSSNDWETIIALCQNDAVPDTWKIGDGKNISYSDGGSCRATIIGKNHDDTTDGKKAALTIAVRDSIATAMNETSTNEGGWGQSLMRTSHCKTLENKLPAVIKNNLCTIIKYTAECGGSTSLDMTQDRLFLLSEVEYTGQNTKSAIGEGKEYAYFISGNTINEYTFLRSPNGTSNFCVYQPNSGVVAYNAATYFYKNLMAFCL